MISSQPARLEDIAPTALTLMGVSHDGMQGIPLADAIQSATAQEWAQEQSLGAQLRPVTNALRTEAAAEVAQKR
jgi:arylsulfatase A-like enzyme